MDTFSAQFVPQLPVTSLSESTYSTGNNDVTMHPSLEQLSGKKRSHHKKKFVSPDRIGERRRSVVISNIGKDVTTDHLTDYLTELFEVVILSKCNRIAATNENKLSSNFLNFIRIPHPLKQKVLCFYDLNVV